MTFEEKSTWVSVVVSVLAVGAYFTFVLRQMSSVPVVEIAYQWPMLVSVGAMVLMTIVGTILMSIGTAISASLAGRASVNDMDRKDERDDQINSRGELVGYYFSSAGILGVLALAMLRYDQFWIANALYLTLVAGGLLSAAAKLVAYRRGF